MIQQPSRRYTLVTVLPLTLPTVRRRLHYYQIDATVRSKGDGKFTIIVHPQSIFRYETLLRASVRWFASDGVPSREDLILAEARARLGASAQ